MSYSTSFSLWDKTNKRGGNDQAVYIMRNGFCFHRCHMAWASNRVQCWRLRIAVKKERAMLRCRINLILQVFLIRLFLFNISAACTVDSMIWFSLHLTSPHRTAPTLCFSLQHSGFMAISSDLLRPFPALHRLYLAVLEFGHLQSSPYTLPDDVL